MVIVRPEYLAWAKLLRYPGRETAPEIRTRVQELLERSPELSEDLAPLERCAVEHGDSHLEELFTRTFDSNAERALEVGWHLHGENYARGVLMVRVRRMLRDHGIPETEELPDHVSHLLMILARADDTLTRALACQILGPALAKVLVGFPDEDNPYRGVVHALRRYLESQYPGREWSVAPPEVVTPSTPDDLQPMGGCSDV